MSIELLEHQKIAVEWLSSTGRAILADKTGLGKTYPAIIAAMHQPAPRLFVVPAHLQYNWEYAIAEVDGSIPVYATRGNATDRRKMIYTYVSGHGPRAILLTTYEHLRMHAPQFHEVVWGVALFDEAQKLRGRGARKRLKDGTVKRLTLSQQAEAAFKLHTIHLYLLTATPQMSSVADYWALLHMIDPAKYSSYWRFVTEFVKIQETPWGPKLKGAKDPDRMRAEIAPYILRRSFKDAGIPMPDVVHKLIYVPPPKHFMRRYFELRKTFRQGDRVYLSVSSMVSELYRITSAMQEKLHTLQQLIAEYPDEPLIIWTWRRDTASLIADQLARRGRVRGTVFMVHGDVPKKQRQRDIDTFRRSKNGRLVTTIASIATGENLQNARRCIFYEQSYLAADNEQAVGRLQRIGQQMEEPVEAIHLLVPRTIDIAVHKAQLARAEESEQLLSDLIWEGIGDGDD